MGKRTKEKGLIVYDNNVVSRIRRFFTKRFGRWRKTDLYTEEIELNMPIQEEEPVQKRPLFNYDAYDDDNVNSNVVEENETGETQNQDINEILNERNQMDTDISNNNYETYRNEEDDDVYNYENEYLNQKRKAILEEKEELERKLLNFYAKIKKGL